MAAVKISVGGDALDVRRPIVGVVALHPGLAEIALDRRGAVEGRAYSDGRRSGLNRIGVGDLVRDIPSGVHLGAKLVERRGEGL